MKNPDFPGSDTFEGCCPECKQPNGTPYNFLCEICELELTPPVSEEIDFKQFIKEFTT